MPDTKPLKRWQLVTAAGATGLLAAFFCVWFVWFSDAGYQPPQSVVIDETVEHRVFAYGTLRFAPLRYLVIGRHERPKPAMLQGFERHGLDIAPHAGGQVNGVVFTVTAGQLARLDRYERLDILYRRKNVILDDGTNAWVYLLIERTP